ncbi:MAG: MgtC/SapB family protein [Alphaproteobacteria bacterium]
MIPDPDLTPLLFLGISLAIGLLIGLERGWDNRDIEEGQRVAGLRTYGIIGLLGGGAGLAGGDDGDLLPGLGIVAVALLFAVAYFRRTQESADIGATSIFAGLLTFVLGALVPLGYEAPAVAAAVVTTMLLGFKPTLHDWVSRLEEHELHATLKFLLISVALLPVLPNQTIGPLDAFNPYETWWMVVLIAGLSYVGYFAIKIGGARHGALLTGIFGGLASSTAVTLSLSRLAPENAGQENALASGILAAGATMYPRILIIASALNPALVLPLLLPLAIMTVGTYMAAGLAWWLARKTESDAQPTIRNPFRLKEAIGFGLLLVVVLALSQLLIDTLGHSGVYFLAAVSGLANVDAITLSLGRMTLNELPVPVFTLGVLIAATANGAAKAAISGIRGGMALGWRVSAGLLIPLAAGMAWFMARQIS